MNDLNQEWSVRWSESLNNNYGTPTITLDRGKGSEVWDLNGVRYVDMLQELQQIFSAMQI